MSRFIRAAGIVIKDDEVLLIWRKNESEEFYVFPGGSVEKDETIKEAVIREILEETSIQVKLDELIYHHQYETSDQYYYLCEYKSGDVKLDEESVELKRTLKGADLYKPLWVKIDKLPGLLLYPFRICIRAYVFSLLRFVLKDGLIIYEAPSLFQRLSKEMLKLCDT